MMVISISETVIAAISAAASTIAGMLDERAAAAYYDQTISVPAAPSGSLTVVILGNPDIVPADHPAAIARAALHDRGIDTGLYAIRAGADGVEYLHLTLDVSRDEGAQTLVFTAAGVVEWASVGGWRWREFDRQWVRLEGPPGA